MTRRPPTPSLPHEGGGGRIRRRVVQGDNADPRVPPSPLVGEGGGGGAPRGTQDQPAKGSA